MTSDSDAPGTGEPAPGTGEAAPAGRAEAPGTGEAAPAGRPDDQAKRPEPQRARSDAGTTGNGAPSGTRPPNRRKVREGLVVSTQMDQTAVVAVIERVRHPRYVKTVQRTKRLYVHDPANDVRVGDRVRLQETRPLSKLKRWRIIDILERAK